MRSDIPARLPIAKGESWFRVRIGFTLIELMIVLALIALLAGGLGVFLTRDGGSEVALRAAQAEVAGLLSLGSREAYARGESLRILVPLEMANGSEGILRSLRLARPDPSREVGGWRTLGGTVDLPRGIGIVPPVVPTENLTSGINWPSGLSVAVSNLQGPEILEVDRDAGRPYYFADLETTGKPKNGALRLVLAPMELHPDSPPKFVGPELARGVKLMPGGTVITVEPEVEP